MDDLKRRYKALTGYRFKTGLRLDPPPPYDEVYWKAMEIMNEEENSMNELVGHIEQFSPLLERTVNHVHTYVPQSPVVTIKVEKNSRGMNYEVKAEGPTVDSALDQIREAIGKLKKEYGE